jgi:hypothetical protein
MEMDRTAAEQRIKGPAIGILVTAVVGGLWALASLAMNLLGAGLAPMAGGSEEIWVQATSGVYGAVMSLIGLGVAGFLVWGGLKMMRLESWGIALMACILAMVPCVSPCCLIGLPFGIWGLVVINDQAVKQAFRG